MNHLDTKPKKKKNKLVIVLLVMFVLFLVFAVGAMVFLHSKLNRINKVDESNVEMIPREEETFELDDGQIQEGAAAEDGSTIDVVWDNVDINIMRDENVKNILLIGQDRRENQGRQRSDTMIICSINKNTKKLILTSVMRDMYVPIPGYSDNRINAAYQFGGMPLLNQVMEESLGIHIDGNVEVDFNGFISAMSYVGDLEIELYQAEADYLNRGYGWNLTAGVNYLTPEQALAYSRVRYVGNSDWERTDRQRRVIMAALDNVKHLSFMELVELADNILPYFTTDMTNNEILGYIYTVVANGITTTESHRIPVDGTYTNQTLRKGMEVLVPNLSENSRYLKQYIYGN